MNGIKIKVCGMKEVSNVEAVCRHSPDYLGFIFYRKSVRYVGVNPGADLFEIVPPGITKTAVFVNEYYERIIEITGKYNIDHVQLHGMESPEMCRLLKLHGKTVIKAIPGNQLHDTRQLREYSRVADYLLFDAPVKSYGGSGRKFDWTNLEGLEVDHPFYLSGGIGIDDADKIHKMDSSNLYAVDINSRFEVEPGIKNPELVGLFIKQIRNEE